MTREEHLLVILAEECGEVIKEVAKALRFGLDDHKPGEKETNRENIELELNDMLGVVNMLVSGGSLNMNIKSNLYQEAKQRKVEKYLLYSENVGKLK